MAVRVSIQVNSINVPLPVWYGALELGLSCGRTAGPRPQRPLATTYGAINASGEPFCLPLFGRCHSRSINVTWASVPWAPRIPVGSRLVAACKHRRLRKDAPPNELERETLGQRCSYEATYCTVEHLQQTHLHERRMYSTLREWHRYTPGPANRRKRLAPWPILGQLGCIQHTTSERGTSSAGADSPTIQYRTSNAYTTCLFSPDPAIFALGHSESEPWPFGPLSWRTGGYVAGELALRSWPWGADPAAAYLVLVQQYHGIERLRRFDLPAKDGTVDDDCRGDPSGLLVALGTTVTAAHPLWLHGCHIHRH